MAKYGKSRSVPIIITVVVIVIIAIAVISLIRAIISSSQQSNTTSSVTDTSEQALLNTTDGHKVVLTVRGPIVADENFHSYRIEISASARKLTTYNGYLKQQVDAVTLGNNVSAYDQFVSALDKANLASGTQLEGDADNTEGICASGRVYEYYIMNNDDVIKHLWTSTCGGSKGSLKANEDQVTQLFINQFPNAQGVISKVDL